MFSSNPNYKYFREWYKRAKFYLTDEEKETPEKEARIREETMVALEALYAKTGLELEKNPIKFLCTKELPSRSPLWTSSTTSTARSA